MLFINRAESLIYIRIKPFYASAPEEGRMDGVQQNRLRILRIPAHLRKDYLYA